MKRITRRQFAALAGSAALAPVAAKLGATPAAADAAPEAGAELDLQQGQQPEAVERKPPLTDEQAERVAQSVARRDRQLAGLRGRTLDYALEPAFVFRVKTKA